jgi:YegS/Rv2252/BmrU family lipid kinase
MKILLIVNPMAGKGRAGEYMGALVSMYAEKGAAVTAVATRSSGDAQRIASESGADYDLVVCMGGDGTLHEVVSGLMKLENRPRLGYIPAGTTNDLASTLGLPKDIMEAGRAVLDGGTAQMDVGSFESDHFMYLASFGLLSEVAYSTPQKKKNAMGRLAYILYGIMHLKDIRTYHARIECDDGVLEEDYLFCSITNTHRIAGMLSLEGKQVSLNDGLFELLLLKDPRNPFLLMKVIASAFLGKYDERYIKLLRTSKVNITSAVSIPWCLDGERGGSHRTVRIFNRKQNLAMVC